MPFIINRPQLILTAVFYDLEVELHIIFIWRKSDTKKKDCIKIDIISVIHATKQKIVRNAVGHL